MDHENLGEKKHEGEEMGGRKLKLRSEVKSGIYLPYSPSNPGRPGFPVGPGILDPTDSPGGPGLPGNPGSPGPPEPHKTNSYKYFWKPLFPLIYSKVRTLVSRLSLASGDSRYSWVGVSPLSLQPRNTIGTWTTSKTPTWTQTQKFSSSSSSMSSRYWDWFLYML